MSRWGISTVAAGYGVPHQRQRVGDQFFGQATRGDPRYGFLSPIDASVGNKTATVEGKPYRARYAQAHRAKRKALAPAVAVGLYNCARCGERIEPGEPWDLGHADAMVFATPAHSTDAVTARQLATARSAS